MNDHVGEDVQVSVDRRTAFDVKCSRCGHREEFGNESEANQRRIKHAQEHATSLAVAPAIADQVFRSEDHVTWLGHVSAAQEAARKASKPYLTWNGRVYRTELVDFVNPVCWSDDLPAIEVFGSRPCHSDASYSGVDQTDVRDPEKVWRCDSCGEEGTSAALDLSHSGRQSDG